MSRKSTSKPPPKQATPCPVFSIRYDPEGTPIVDQAELIDDKPKKKTYRVANGVEWESSTKELWFKSVEDACESEIRALTVRMNDGFWTLYRNQPRHLFFRQLVLVSAILASKWKGGA